MKPFGIACGIIVLITGIAMYFVGYLHGIGWAVNEFKDCCEKITGRNINDTSREVEQDK